MNTSINTTSPKTTDKEKEVVSYTPIPISVVRSALFSVARDGERAVKKKIYVENGPLGLLVEYTGPHLNQEHFKVWQAVIHLARENRAMSGEQFVLPTSTVLRRIGCNDDSYSHYDRVWRLLKDLVEATVYIKSKRSHYIGHLVFAAGREDDTGKTFIRLNPDLSQLLGDEVLWNDMLRLTGLGRDQIATWLHNYYASHKTPPPISVKELQKMCGTKLDLPRFRQRLKPALEKIRGGIRPLIVEYSIEKDIVRVVKTQTKVTLLPPNVAVAKKQDTSEHVSAAVRAARAQRASVAL